MPFCSFKDYARAHFQEQFTENFLPTLLAALSFSLPQKNSLLCWYMMEGSHEAGQRQVVCLRLLSMPSTLLRSWFILAFMGVSSNQVKARYFYTEIFLVLVLMVLLKRWNCCCLSCSPSLMSCIPFPIPLADLLVIITNTLGLPNNRGP